MFIKETCSTYSYVGPTTHAATQRLTITPDEQERPVHAFTYDSLKIISETRPQLYSSLMVNGDSAVRQKNNRATMLFP
jgi:hypothetical protein